MKVEYNPITNFKLLKDIPEGKCFKKIDNDEILKIDSAEIFMKINKTNEDDYPADNWKMTFYCVDISNGDLRYMVYDTKVIPVSGKFVVNSDITCIISDQTDKKTGYWTLDETDNSVTCDNCGCTIYPNDIINGEPHFCTNCGLEMKG